MNQILIVAGYRAAGKTTFIERSIQQSAGIQLGGLEEGDESLKPLPATVNCRVISEGDVEAEGANLSVQPDENLIIHVDLLALIQRFSRFYSNREKLLASANQDYEDLFREFSRESMSTFLTQVKKIQKTREVSVITLSTTFRESKRRYLNRRRSRIAQQLVNRLRIPLRSNQNLPGQNVLRPVVMMLDWAYKSVNGGEWESRLFWDRTNGEITYSVVRAEWISAVKSTGLSHQIIDKDYLPSAN